MRSKIVYGKGGTPDRFYLNGQEVTAAEFKKRTRVRGGRKAFGIPGGTATTGWPMVSEALAVDPSQVAEANERNRKAGVNVQYHPKTGCAIIPDAAARKRLLKLERFFDRDAFC